MHPLPAFVMRDGDWAHGQAVLGLDQTLDPIGDGVERVEDVEEPRTENQRNYLKVILS